MFVSIDQYCESVLIFFRLFGRQIGTDHCLFPLLPPNRFLYLDKKRVVNVTTVSDARWHYNTYLELHAFNKKTTNVSLSTIGETRFEVDWIGF